MGKAYLLTGEPRVGKTTAIKKMIDSLGPERCGGFYTEEMCAAGERYGFRIMTLDGHFGMLADIAYTNTSLKVGKYGVVLPFLENFALAAVYNALASKEIVVIDEMGPMQLFSDKLMLAVMSVLESTRPLVGTAFSGSHPWLNELKQRGDVELFELTDENRNDVPKMVIETLRDI